MEIISISERELLQKWLANLQTRVMVLNQETDLLVHQIQLIQEFISGGKNE